MGLTNDVDITSNGNTIISGNGSVYCYSEGGCTTDKPGQFQFGIAGNLKRFLDNPGGNVYAIEYSPDETVIASGTGYNNNGDIKIYDNNFNLLRTLDGHQYETDGLVFTHDEQYLISGGDDGLVKAWDYNSGTLIRTLVHGDYLNGGTNVDVDASADGQYFSSAGQGYNMTVKIWRVSDGALIQTLPIDGGYGYNTARFSPDGKYIVSGTTQYEGRLGWHGEILVWRISDGALVKQYTEKEGSPLSGGIRTIAFSSLSKHLFAYSVSDKLKVIDFNAMASESIAAKKFTDNSQSNTSAFPNPFTSTTTIQYSIAAKQFVTLRVYDIHGTEVATLVNEEKPAGQYHVLFNPGKLMKGIYFYKLNAGSYSEVKQIILDK